MTPTLPLEGIAEVRRLWSGRGTIWEATAAVGQDGEVEWSPQLARRRACRIVFELTKPHLVSWPDSVREWIDALPAQSYRERVLADAPRSGVQWAETRRLGWPPKVFVVKERHRIAETLLLTTLRWTIENLIEIHLGARRVLADIGAGLEPQINAVGELLHIEPVRSAEPIVPSVSDLTLLRGAGRPWGAVATVARLLRLLDHDQDDLANRLIDPDPAMADRLFHVAVLGLTLRTLRENRWSLRPISLFGGTGSGPIISATSPAGELWDIWFEGSGAWTFYSATEPYPTGVQGIAGTGGPLGADIALFHADERAVLIECKFSLNPNYVGRQGYEQTLAYMGEALTIVASCSGVLVGPSEIVSIPGLAATAIGDLHVVDPVAFTSVLPDLVGG